MLELLNFTYNKFNIADTGGSCDYKASMGVRYSITAIFHVKVFEAGLNSGVYTAMTC